jgi:signal transduction histidine kinase
VRDTGVGIPKNRLEKLFSLAAEPAVPGTQGERGTGLGLALCKDLVLRCNGDIFAESTLGSGSYFRFTLPISEPA